jgi:hypothetical protein
MNADTQERDLNQEEMVFWAMNMNISMVSQHELPNSQHSSRWMADWFSLKASFCRSTSLPVPRCRWVRFSKLLEPCFFLPRKDKQRPGHLEMIWLIAISLSTWPYLTHNYS